MNYAGQTKLFGKIKVDYIHSFFSGYQHIVKFEDKTEISIFNHKLNKCVISLGEWAHGYDTFNMKPKDFIDKLINSDDIQFKIDFYSRLAVLKYRNTVEKELLNKKKESFKCTKNQQEIFKKLASADDFFDRLYSFLFPNDWYKIVLPKVKGLMFPKINAKQFCSVQSMTQPSGLNFELHINGETESSFGEVDKEVADKLEQQAKQILKQAEQRN